MIRAKVFNGVFHFGKFIGRIGRFFQDLSIYLHIRFKTPTGIKLTAAFQQAQAAIDKIKAEYSQQAPQGEEGQDFRSFFGPKKPGTLN
jgi:hypothetical protein